MEGCFSGSPRTCATCCHPIPRHDQADQCSLMCLMSTKAHYDCSDLAGLLPGQREWTSWPGCTRAGRSYSVCDMSMFTAQSTEYSLDTHSDMMVSHHHWIRGTSRVHQAYIEGWSSSREAQRSPGKFSRTASINWIFPFFLFSLCQSIRDRCTNQSKLPWSKLN